MQQELQKVLILLHCEVRISYSMTDLAASVPYIHRCTAMTTRHDSITPEINVAHEMENFLNPLDF